MRLPLLLLLSAWLIQAASRFEITVSPAARSSPADGRLILVISKNLEGEPRFHTSWGTRAQQIFGVDVNGVRPGETIRVDETAAGFPLRTLRELPAGEYNVQAVLHIYETFRRSDGHVLKLPMDDGEGQQWSRSPGNLFSRPRQMQIGADSLVAIELSEAIPPIEPPKDTRYVRHLRIESKLLTKFWGRPMHLGAIVLAPPGFDDSPSQRYPIVFNQGHFPPGFPQFRETPPPPGLEGAEKQRADTAYRFFQEWSSGRLPKMLIVRTQHPTPYYDDSYGVNTANMGPYGDALTQELYPAVEQQFRAIGEPWARIVYGGSTGGWMTLAQQIFYPDYFGGAWGFCPDPVDFHAFQLINAYQDKNAWYDIGPFQRTPKPLARSRDGNLLATVEDFSRQEAVLGTRGRSGGQLDAFHAVFGPVGPDGYPAPLWNPDTGEIDAGVARYWREHYDLTAILMRDWTRLGPKLDGKLHITMGDKDTFYLDVAVRRLERFLESTRLPGKGPYYGGSIRWGDEQPHCWPGEIPPGQTTESHYLPVFADHIRKMAPEGADLDGWLR